MSFQQLRWTFLQSKPATSLAFCCVCKLHILECPLITTSPRLTWELIMLSNQHMPWICLGEGKVLTNKKKIVPNIWDKMVWVTTEKVSNLLRKIGVKNKSIYLMLSVHITCDWCLWLDNNLPLISILPMKTKIDCNQVCEQAIWMWDTRDDKCKWGHIERNIRTWWAKV